MCVDCSVDKNIKQLYQQTGQAALSKIVHLLGRRDIAEEILHDIFIKLWQKRLRFRNIKAAYCWIYRSCHNASIDYLRSAAYRKESINIDDIFPELDDCVKQESSVDVVQIRDQIIKLLHKLPERMVHILIYREIDGMTQEEIAEFVGVSRKTIVRDCKKLDEMLPFIKGDD